MIIDTIHYNTFISILMKKISLFIQESKPDQLFLSSILHVQSYDKFTQENDKNHNNHLLKL